MVYTSVSDLQMVAVLRSIPQCLICRWWRPQFCPNHRQSATTESLNLETVAGMYLVLLAGVVLLSLIHISEPTRRS